MRLEDLDYPLPKELIAQRPLEKRDASRLLIVDRKRSTLEDLLFSDLPSLIPPGDALVLNDTRVLKARVLGKKKVTGGKVDILLLAFGGKPDENVWQVLVQPALKEGQEVDFSEGVEGVFAGRDPQGTALMRFKEGFDVRAWAQRVGTMPLPPYIKREAGPEDVGMYQTVYAQKDGAVAAPTAGLHFTPELLKGLNAKGVEVEKVTLHVGTGTFKPVEDLESHKMHSEVFELSAETALRLNAVKEKKHEVWAVGTTSLRVLETCVRKKRLAAGAGETDLFIRPPFEFEAVDHLITNFHLPKTTLLLLVSAFMGETLRKKAYDHAIQEKYRFYSYGDAMLIL